MSTFNGEVVEFPDIRIDYFRKSPDPSSRPPLAFFLSHVHSDHLVGLESCKSPFIYCSPATRDILLRLEKYPHRMNFAKGILETRKQTYRHLKNLLKAIPLETPTVIELSPGNEVRVTLLDANHCVGAVMFLIEGGDPHKAVLYTGDIRSELWWVNSLTRNPILVPYLCFADQRPETRLDNIYLDTTFVVTREDPYKQFPSKSDGLKELLQKVSRYPEDTLFYIDAWTFGYEEVWQALSHYFNCQVHVDEYRYGLYLALVSGTEPKDQDGAKLIGFNCGNHVQTGCLTPRQSRLHSCEKGTGCEIWSKDFVRITPIVSRYNGVEMAELGAGGGQSDLNQQHELEVGDTESVRKLMTLCASKLGDLPQLLSAVLQMLASIIDDNVQAITLDNVDLKTGYEGAASAENDFADLEDMPIEKLLPALMNLGMKAKQQKTQSRDAASLYPSGKSTEGEYGLPKQITFPYSRHSSYDELCILIEAFQPKEIHPCTVDESKWTATSSMSSLFGHLYYTCPSFRHDRMMLKRRGIDHVAVVTDSRPGRPASVGPVSGEHAIPMNNSIPSHDPRHLEKPGSQASSPPRKSSNEDGKELVRQTTKQRRGARQTNVDHYSPPRLPVGPMNGTPYEAPRRLPALSEANARNKPDFRSSLQRQIAQSLPQAWQSADNKRRNRSSLNGSHLTQSAFERSCERRDRKRSRNRSPLGYGRLSPPPIVGYANIGDRENEYDLVRGRRRVSHENVGPSVAVSSRSFHSVTSDETRLAYRQEAYDAALGSERTSWSDIGLATVNGHNIDEEEL